MVRLLLNDKEFVATAHACHKAKDANKRREFETELKAGFTSRAVQEMRDFIVQNESLIPKGEWSKKSVAGEE